MNVDICECGKRTYRSRSEADQAVVDAKIRGALRPNVQRGESSVYPCRTAVGIWHVSSQPRREPDYPTDDDEAAEQFINWAVRNDSAAPWDLLFADDRVFQTVRVLVRMHQSVLAQATAWKARLAAVKAEVNRGDRPSSDYADIQLERAKWQERVAFFQAATLTRLQEGRQHAIGASRQSVSAQAGNALRQLTLAVAAHRTATTDPTTADRQLWAWLDVLTVSTVNQPGKGRGKGPRSLTRMLETSWAPRAVDEG